MHSLISLGLRAEDIAVITPYNGQVECLRKILLPDIPKLEIKSVDGFQGGEREAVVLSLVRSSDRGELGVGFLRDERRLNVAITRAKRHCAVICDCETVSKNKFIKGLVDWMEEKGEYRSGAEYTDMYHSTASSIPTSKPPKQTNGKQSNLSMRQPKVSKGQSSASAKLTPGPANTLNMPKKDDSKMRIESARVALMERIKSFSESGEKGDELNLLLPPSDYDCVIAKELASQLGLGCREGEGTNKLVLSILKDSKSDLSAPPPVEDINPPTSSKFAQLNIDDDESSESDEDTKEEPSNLLRELAQEREKRESGQQKVQASKPLTTKKQKKKKGKGKGGQKLGGANQHQKNQIDNNLDDLDDMAFLDAQIDSVQTSHGRKIEAKGKGYRSVVSLMIFSFFYDERYSQSISPPPFVFAR